jgi:hypothetical protein
VRRLFPAALIALTAMASTGCGNNDSSTTSPSSTTRSTETFTGTLAVGDSQFYSFTVSQSGTTDITLASLRANGYTPLAAPIGLGIGTPAGTGCEMTTTMDAIAALTPQISTSLTTGIHCVDIYDAGTLNAPAPFNIRIVHP